MTHREYQAYWDRRWNELGIPAKMDEITRRHAVTFDEAQVLRRLSAARKAGRMMAVPKRVADLEETYKAVQCPAMVQVAGELYHKEGHKDVGLSTKNGGNHWPLPDGRKVATDIFTIKPTDDAGNVVPGNFVLVDCLFSGGSADTRPVWNVLGENTDSSRPWMEPPLPEGTVIEPGPTHRYIGGGNDTGRCDECSAPRNSPVHAVPEGKVPHEPWLGEDGKGGCDLCFQPVDADIHQKKVPQPEEPVETYHPFVGSTNAKYCEECGQRRENNIHQKPQEPPPVPGNLDTAAIVAAIEKASEAEVAAITELRQSVIKAVKDLGGLGGLFGGLTKPPKKSSKRK